MSPFERDSAVPTGTGAFSKGTAPKVRKAIALFLVAGLLYLAFRQVPLAAIGEVLRRLHIWQLALLVVIDLAIYLLVTGRWWLIIHAENKLVRYLPLLPVRISVFGLSYFTLGPQVGGEPLQVMYLQRSHGFTFTRATATVVMDKLLEFVANFFFLILGLTAALRVGLLSNVGGTPLWGIVVPVGLLLWPLVHIGMLYRKRYPLSSLLNLLPLQYRNSRLLRFVRASEQLAGRFCQRHPRLLAVATLFSLAAAAGTIAEYGLMLLFLQIALPFEQTVAAWTASWLSFLLPLPGGLGALEASQVFALNLFGISAATAITVTLLIRSRDILIGGLGLLLASNAARRH